MCIRDRPGAPADIDRRARDILTSWGGKIQDYARRDYYELVRDYYRPRVRIFAGSLRTAMKMGIRSRMRPAGEYERLEQDWIRNGFPLMEAKPDPTRVIGTVEQILREFS